ncbi:MAG: clostripain-related cysteine peptidase, partial [Candidatus Undinarchaeales archaeon]|nr:clostripain-related cysteine peptidase [Candidatus Undinarchaeales archaeon]
ACLMASAEGAYQVRSVTDFLVASQELEGAEGWPYEGIMGNRALVVMEKFSTAFKDGKRPELTPKLMSFLIVKEAENDQRNLPTLSAVEVEKMPKVAEAMDGFAEALRGSKVPISEFNKIAEESFHFGRQWWFEEPLVDAVELAEKVSANGAYGADVREAAAKVIEAVDQVVVAEQHNETSHPNAHGLHIYVPFNGPPGEGQDSFDGDKYGELDFAEDTQWDEFLQERANQNKGGQ